MLKKWKIVVNRISRVRQTTCNWIKKILDKATSIINVLLISWFFYLFSVMFNKLTCKVWFHVAVWSLSVSNCYKNVWLHWKLSSNQRKTNRFPAKFAWEALTKLAVLYQSFFSETGLENSCEIPAKSAVSSANLSLKIPRNLIFFSVTYQKPWISAADIAFMMSSSKSAWSLSPLECSPQKQNGWTLRFCFWGWIMWKMYNKTIIEFSFRMISWIIKTSCLRYLPQASADNTDLGFDNSWYHAQPHPIIV